MKKICIVGGGNLGHYIAAKLGNRNDIFVYTRNGDEWADTVVAEDIDGSVFSGKIQRSCQNAEATVGQAEVIFITWPTNVISARFHEIEKSISENAWVCFCPGYGGKEFICKSLIDRGVHVFGTQRVFSSTKILDYGKKVACIDNRPAIHLAAMKKCDMEKCGKLLEHLFEKKCIVYDNYLNISLTPSNPVLHTSRLYSLFKEYEPTKCYSEKFKFYSEWDIESSRVLIACDAEVQMICKALNKMDMTGVKSLKNHYEIQSVEDCTSDEERMTQKLRSLKFLKDQAPMVAKGEGYVPDMESRYFQEDFVFGLRVIQNLARICNVETKQIDEIMAWFEKIADADILQAGMSAVPQKYGILSKEELMDFYLS